MNRERWRQVEAIFHAALERSDEERATFLEQACAGDASLQEEVAGLLAYDDPNTSFIERPALEVLGEGRDERPPFGAGLPTPPMDLTEGLTNRDGDLRSAPWTGRETRPQQETRPQPGNETADATLLSDTPPDAPHAKDDLPSGRQIQNYRIVRKIGAGGMGEVYLAENLRLGRRVALKLLPVSLHVGGKGGRRFLREARAASALNHPNIVTIYNADEADGLSFIEMEYIEGESLRERLARGSLELQEVIALGLQAADAAAAAHAINIVHRDLKPGNILLTASGLAKIVDFGLAKVADAAAAVSSGEKGDGSLLGEASTRGAEAGQKTPVPFFTSVSLSQAGSVSGTVPYMSPEQTRGEHIDARSDIFSLGCVLYEAATGRRPFEGTVPTEIIHKIRESDPPRPSSLRPGLPRRFDRIIELALAKEPARRYATAADLSSDLRRLRTVISARRFAKRAWPGVTAAALLVAALAWWLHDRGAKRAWAASAIPDVQRLVKEERFFEAHDLAARISRYLPHSTEIEELTPWFVDQLSVTSEPPGANVYLQRCQKDADGRFPPAELIGITPFKDRTIPRGLYSLRIEKEGYVPFDRTVSSVLGRLENGIWNRGALRHLGPAETGSRAVAADYDLSFDSYAPIEIDATLWKGGRRGRSPTEWSSSEGGRTSSSVGAARRTRRWRSPTSSSIAARWRIARTKSSSMPAATPTADFGSSRLSGTERRSPGKTRCHGWSIGPDGPDPGTGQTGRTPPARRTIPSLA